MRLMLKLHPRYLAWKLGQEHGTIILQNNLLKNYDSIKKLFLSFSEKGICSVYFENPHIELQGSLIKVFHDIQHIQRTVGMLEVFAWETYGVSAHSLVPVMGYTMQQKIDLFDSTFTSTTYFSPLEKMCIAECILLEKSL